MYILGWYILVLDSTDEQNEYSLLSGAYQGTNYFRYCKINFDLDL